MFRLDMHAHIHKYRYSHPNTGKYYTYSHTPSWCHSHFYYRACRSQPLGALFENRFVYKTRINLFYVDIDLYICWLCYIPFYFH